MHRIFQRNNNGFTIAELLVVVAILGLLTAVGVTAAYRSIVVMTERRMVENNLRTIDAAIVRYYVEGKGNTQPLQGDNLFELLVPDYLPEVISGPGSAKYRVSDRLIGEFPNAQVVTAEGEEVGGYELNLKSYYSIWELPWYYV